MTEPEVGRKPLLALPVRLLWAAALVLPVFGAQAGVVLTPLYSFSGGANGAQPDGGLVQGSDGNFYGTTLKGGTNGGYGTVFSITTNGALTSLHSFTGNDGRNPQAVLVQGTDGNFYSTTAGGGTNGEYGTVFRITTNGAMTSLHSFTGKNDGAYPVCGLVQGSDGYFYGTTQVGGTNGGNGTVFKISTNGSLITLYAFTGANDGGYPLGQLVQGNDGKFYGTTELGGTNGGYGTVFSITTNGALTSLHSFTGNDGNDAQAALVQGSDGNFYGTTLEGGTNGEGNLFKISTNGALTTLCDFGIGAYPNWLVQDSNGIFYGTTELGGTNDKGTVFSMTTNGALTSLYSFTGGNDGSLLYDGLVQGSDGSFYGTTSRGGLGGVGTVFRLTVVPEFQAVVQTNGTLSLTWSTEAGGMYQLQYNSNLSSTNWTNLGGPVTGTGATLSKTDYLTNGPQRFYRLVLAP